MRHYPAPRYHPALAGISRPRERTRGHPVLVAAVWYAAGFFTGAILFGELVLTLHR